MASVNTASDQHDFNAGEPDLARQLAYRQRVHKAFREAWRPYLDRKGRWIESTPNFQGKRRRGMLWSALAFYSGDDPADHELGDGLIRQVELAEDHFMPGAAMTVLLQHGSAMAADARQRLEDYLLWSVPYLQGEDLRFHGYNDNHPAKAASVLALTGEYFDESTITDFALGRMRQFERVLKRRGFYSEFNSPTYSAVSLVPWAELVNHAKDPTIRELALAFEHRQWLDTAAHFHAPTGILAGPHSRAYADGFEGGSSHLNQVIAMALGAGPLIDPIDDAFDAERQHTADYHMGSHDTPDQQAFLIFATCTVLHVPRSLREMLLHKPYPFHVVGTYEHGSQREDNTHPCRHGDITSYLTEDYALGTSSHTWLNGRQNDVCYLNYRRCTSVEHMDDTQAVYCRYVIGDHWPGKRRINGETHPQSEVFNDQGLALTVQHENTAMVLYRPSIGQAEAVSADQLRMFIVWPLKGRRDVDEVWIGNRKLPGQVGYSPEEKCVFIKDGSILVGIRPLILTPMNSCHGRRVYIRRSDDHLVIELYNYQGWSPQQFMESDLQTVGNGFVMEVRTDQEAGGFDTFREMVHNAQTHDELFSHMRTVSYRRPGLELGASFNPATMTDRYREINGQAITPPPLAITGVDLATVPLLGGASPKASQ